MGKIIAKRRHPIRKSQVAELIESLNEEIGASAELFTAKTIEVLETGTQLHIYLVDKEPLLLEKDGVLFPSLKGALARPFPERRIVVDMGAVSFVINGADIMRPGVKSVSPDVKAGRPVQIVDERHGKPLALGIALFDAEDLMAQEKGKVIKTFHHVGDEIWTVEL
ncbi:MAG TPA: RNA-binding protein [Methanospirillum sp.]|uniref:RNA-binding protein n=1 Tax=Methanospirillum sp. TaxID=45200 RepID=UPI002B822BE4|nr:RNA-binding protein [Methanospirillum sp.]HWQ64933.1 RNA-binding protein [Methanospirillum sp.]